MEATVQQAQTLHDDVGPSQPPPTNEVQGSNEDGTTIEISSELVFGLDDLDIDEIDQPVNSDDFMLIFDDEESSGSQHSTSKPKEKKNKKS